MTIKEKSREELVSEIGVLRHELENIREHVNVSLRPRDTAHDGFWSTLVHELPEYLYSIEYTHEKISGAFHSAQCQEITGYSPIDYLTNPDLWMQMIHTDDRDKVLVFLHELRQPLHCRSIEHRIIHKDGSVRWVLNMSMVHLDKNGSTLRQAGFLIDVTSRREETERNSKLLDETRHNSLTDDLTQLYNRRAFRVLAGQQVLISEQIKHPLLLFFIDIDRLKYVNDTFGHEAGDKQLIDLAAILRCTFRGSDIIARIGGDEFAVLSVETGPDSGNVLLELFHAAIEERNSDKTNRCTLSVSTGITRHKIDKSDSVSDMLERADRNMYAQKNRKYSLPRTSAQSLQVDFSAPVGTTADTVYTENESEISVA
jgi:diguanylate cyclase (GGDEF)-like protein/PAS domain S-box-containing protein